jgi:hypothetical protein
VTDMTIDEPFWRRCSSCKREIRFDAPYWICSVTTCNRKGSSFVFCSVACWNAHVPTMRHRESWAEEQRSPTREAWASQAAGAQPAIAKAQPAAATVSRSAPSAAAAPEPSGEVPHDVLIVASKLKQYIRARSGMNTSDSVMEVLSRRVRALCDDAITRAAEDGRKTVMDRDF